MANGHNGDENCRLLLQELNGASSLFQCFLEFTRGYLEGTEPQYFKDALTASWRAQWSEHFRKPRGVPQDITVIWVLMRRPRNVSRNGDFVRR
jgi:hypothetical protein